MLTSLQRKILQVCTVAAATREAKRSYHTSEVRGRSWEDPMPEGWWPGGVTPSLRSGAVAKSARLHWHRNGREELPRGQGQEGRQRGDTQPPRSGAGARKRYPMPQARGQGRRAGVATPRLRPRAAAERSNPTLKARGSDPEDQPHVQGAVAGRVQEGLEELSHVEGQEGRQ